MSSFLNFISSAVSEILGSSGNNGAYFVLSCSGSSVSFPVSPSSFEVDNPYNNSTINVNSLGDIKMIGKRGLKTLSLSSFFPAQYYGWEQSYPSTEPYSACSQIETMATSGQPCQITISGTSISMYCTIEDFKYGEKDGTGDVYFTVNLQEYRYIMPESESYTNDATGLKSRVSQSLKENEIVATVGNDTMDTAAKAVQKTMSIAKQATNRINLYKSLVKSGGIDAGTVIRTVENGIKINDKDVIRW